MYNSKLVNIIVSYNYRVKFTEVPLSEVFVHSVRITTLLWGSGLRGLVTPRAMSAAVYVVLLVGSPKPNRSKGRGQTKNDPLVLQVGGWAVGR